MKQIWFFAYLAMIFISSTIDTTIFAQTLNSKEWRNDMVFLAKNLAKVHDDPFFQLTKKEYRKLFTKLYFTIPFKNHTDISIEMAKIVAKIGDERTWIDLTQDSLKFQAYPIELYWFDDGIFVINSTQEYSSIIGQRLVAINHLPIDEIITKLSSLIPSGNEGRLKYISPKYLSIPEILEALDIIDSTNQATYILEKENKLTEVQMTPTSKNKIPWIDLYNKISPMVSLFNQNFEKNYSFQYLSDYQTMQFQYNLCKNDVKLPFDEFIKNMFHEIDNHEIQKVIIDMRHNSGGNKKLLDIFFTELRKRNLHTKSDFIYVMTGRATFAEALGNVYQLRQKANAVIIGEKPGGQLNYFEDVVEFSLPNSQIQVQCSSKPLYTENPKLDTLMPDILVSITADKYFIRQDPVLKTVLSI